MEPCIGDFTAGAVSVEEAATVRKTAEAGVRDGLTILSSHLALEAKG